MIVSLSAIPVAIAFIGLWLTIRSYEQIVDGRGRGALNIVYLILASAVLVIGLLLVASLVIK